MAHFRKPRFSLRVTLLTAVIVPLVGVMLVVSVNLLLKVEQQVERQLQREMELVARSVRQPIAYSLERDREGSIQQALESAFDTRRVFSAHVYDADGNQVASLGPLQPGTADHRRIREVADGERVAGYERIEGREVYSYFLPLTDLGGRLNGLLQVTRHRGEIDQVVGELRQDSWQLIAVATLLIVLVVLAGHQRFIGRPLNDMSKVMRRIQSGERERRARVHGPSEIAGLAETFNAMVESLTSAQREVSDERRRGEALEAQLRHNEKLAAVGRLAAGVAHEMGSPLSVIAGNAQRVLRHEDLDDGRRSILEGIRVQVQRLSDIVRQLLSLGRGAPPQRDRVDLDALCRHVVACEAPEATRLGTTVQFLNDMAEGAGDDTASPSFLMADAVRLEQALMQVLSNAVQAAPGGQVEVAASYGADDVMLSIDDSGPGVAEDVRELLFEPFFTTKPPGEGSGLGLAVTHSIVADHGGDIQIRDSALGGARFVIRLPRTTGAPDTSSGVADKVNGDARRGQASGARR